MSGLVLFLAALYSLPDPGAIAAPTDAQKARIEAALEVLRRGEGEETGPAIRALALVGEAALPAIVRRLNEAEAGERLLLLTAVRRMPRAAPLLAQARKDPHPAVRAWVRPPPRAARPDLRALATKYLDLLAVAERKARVEADEDLKRLDDRLVPPEATYEQVRRRMRDRHLAQAIQRQRSKAAERFAIAGGAALRTGELKPTLDDPVFVAYVGLLREDLIYHAVRGLVGGGAEVAPALEPLLERTNHDPRKILRVLFAVREDRGRGLYDRFFEQREDVQRTLLELAPTALGKDALAPLLERAATSRHDTVRTRALQGLLELDAPAGRDVARQIFDLTRYGSREFQLAAELLARSGDVELLDQYAALEIPDDNSERRPQLLAIQRAARAGLTKHPGREVEALGDRYLQADGENLRTLGLSLVRDREKLLAHARRERDERLAMATALRALDLHGADIAQEVVDLVRARGYEARSLLRGLRGCGRTDLIVQIAVDGAPKTRHSALAVLKGLPSLDAKFEAPLLKLHDAAPDDSRVLAALLPLGTEEVRRRFEAAGADALPILSKRDTPLPFSLPLTPFLKGADAARLQRLAIVAELTPDLETGFFHALFLAWEALPEDQREGEGLDAGAAQQKVKTLEALARSRDKASTARLFERLLRGEVKEPSLALGVIRAAARLLPPQELARLLPLLREAVAKERPLPNQVPPPYDALRAEILRASMNALAYRRVKTALADLCDTVLDPDLYRPAFDWKHSSAAPWRALSCLREFPASRVEPAFREAIARADADGRLARLHPGEMLHVVEFCLTNDRRRGRRLGGVALALCEVLERLPWEGEVTYQRVVALGALARYPEAAAAARADAKRKRGRGFTVHDGYWTPARLDVRARLYDALADKSADRIVAIAGQADGDPFLLYLSAWYLLFMVPDARVVEVAEEALRATAGLYYLSRNVLAAARLQQGRARDALDLLEERSMPLRRRARSGWFLVFRAKAHLMLGDEHKARRALENALEMDRRILPQVRADPAFKELADVFRKADEDYFFEVLFAEEG